MKMIQISHRFDHKWDFLEHVVFWFYFCFPSNHLSTFYDLKHKANVTQVVSWGIYCPFRLRTIPSPRTVQGDVLHSRVRRQESSKESIAPATHVLLHLFTTSQFCSNVEILSVWLPAFDDTHRLDSGVNRVCIYVCRRRRSSNLAIYNQSKELWSVPTFEFVQKLSSFHCPPKTTDWPLGHVFFEVSLKALATK